MERVPQTENDGRRGAVNLETVSKELLEGPENMYAAQRPGRHAGGGTWRTESRSWDSVTFSALADIWISCYSFLISHVKVYHLRIHYIHLPFNSCRRFRHFMVSVYASMYVIVEQTRICVRDDNVVTSIRTAGRSHFSGAGCVCNSVQKSYKTHYVLYVHHSIF